MAYTMEEKSKAFGHLIGCLVGFGIAFLLAWLFNIEGGKEYGWFAGIWHGGWAPINWMRSLLFIGIYVKAPLHTSAYNNFWWVFFVFGLFSYLKLLVQSFIAIRILCK